MREWIRSATSNAAGTLLAAALLAVFGFLGVAVLAAYTRLRPMTWPNPDDITNYLFVFVLCVLLANELRRWVRMGPLLILGARTQRNPFSDAIPLPGAQYVGNAVDVAITLNFKDPHTEVAAPADLNGAELFATLVQGNRTLIRNKPLKRSANVAQVSLSSGETGRMKEGPVAIYVTAVWSEERKYTWMPFLLDMRAHFMP